MRGLTKESRKLHFTCSNITSCAKGTERLGSSYESIVSVESITTSLIVSMCEHTFEKRRADEAANIAITTKQEESKEKYKSKELHFFFFFLL